MNKKTLKDLFIIYRNYLFAIQERNEYGDKYGDTKEIINIYENELKKYGIKKLLPKQ